MRELLRDSGDIFLALKTSGNSSTFLSVVFLAVMNLRWGGALDRNQWLVETDIQFHSH